MHVPLSANKGGGALKDKELLAEAERLGFEVLIKTNKNLPFQQSLTNRKFHVIVLEVPSNKIEDCLPKIPAVLQALTRAQPGTWQKV